MRTFALSVHIQPFKTSKMNKIKMFSEIKICGVLFVCIARRIGAHGLTLTGLASKTFT